MNHSMWYTTSYTLPLVTINYKIISICLVNKKKLKNKNKMNYSVCCLSSYHVCSLCPLSLCWRKPHASSPPKRLFSSDTPGGAITFSHCRRRRKLSLFISPNYRWFHYLLRWTVSVIDFVQGELYLIVDSSIHGC
jgi:hypothetical protein